MVRIKNMFLIICGVLLVSAEGWAAERDLYRLKDGGNLRGWAVAADGEKVLFRKEDGTYRIYTFSELSDSAKSKIEDLRETKAIVNTSQHVESSNSDQDRFLIPTYSQGSEDKNWGCFANAAINFLVWWDRIGVIHIPNDGSEEDKSEWLHSKLYSYVKSYDGTKSQLSMLEAALKGYLEEYPSDYYLFEYEIIPFSSNANAMAENVHGLNMTVLVMSNVDGINRKAGQAVSVIEGTGNNGIILNTWGQTFMAQLFEPYGVFTASDYIKDTTWLIDFTTTCPDAFDQRGRWIIHANDSLLVVRPIRRPDAPLKLIEERDMENGSGSKELEGNNSGQPEEDTSPEEVVRNGSEDFGKDKVLESRVGYADLLFGECLDGLNVRIHGKLIGDYIFAHAPSKVVYAIPDGVHRFRAWGVKPSGNSRIQGTWRYIILIDGERVYRSKPLEMYDDGVVPINIAIPPGSKRLELWVDPMRENSWDHSIWALPEFN